MENTRTRLRRRHTITDDGTGVSIVIWERPWQDTSFLKYTIEQKYINDRTQRMGFTSFPDVATLQGLERVARRARKWIAANR